MSHKGASHRSRYVGTHAANVGVPFGKSTSSADLLLKVEVRGSNVACDLRLQQCLGGGIHDDFCQVGTVLDVDRFGVCRLAPCLEGAHDGKGWISQAE